MYKNSVKRCVNSFDLTLNQAWNAYFQTKIVKGISHDTELNMGFVYERLLNDNKLTGKEPITILTEGFIDDWTAKMVTTTTRSTETINHYIGYVRTFCYWCMSQNYIKDFKITLIKSQEKEIKYFNEEELSKLLKKPKKEDNYMEWRTWVICSFVMATGARAGTVRCIKKSDVDFINREIFYRHLKNKSIAIVPMSLELSRILKEYLSMWDTHDCEWLFCNCGEGQLTVSAIRQALEEYCIRRGVEPRGPHALRHSYARMAIKNGMNAFALQHMLTHSDITMTNRYVKLWGSDLKNGYEQFSPLDNIDLGEGNRLQKVKKN